MAQNAALSVLGDRIFKQTAVGNALDAAFKVEKYSSGVEAILEKMMMLFNLRPPAARSSVRAMQALVVWLSLGLSGRAREGLEECNYFKGKRFT